MALPKPVFLGERAVEHLIGPGKDRTLHGRMIDLQIGPFGLGDVDAVGSSGHVVTCDRRRIKVIPLEAAKGKHEQEENEQHEDAQNANRKSGRRRT